MDRLSKLLHYLRRCGEDELEPRISVKPSSSSCNEKNEDETTARDVRFERGFHSSTKILTILESILLWENTVNSISVVIIFHIIFWGIVVSEIRGFAAASSAALFAVLGYSTYEAQVRNGSEADPPDTTVSPTKVRQMGEIVQKAKSTLEALKILRKNQPGVFCTAVCTFSIALWIIGSTINGALLAYATFMTILIGPALFLRLPRKIFSPRELCHEYTVEWDNEMEEFLPAVTEDNLEVLQRAGDAGEHSPSTHGAAATENHIDPLNEDELVGLKMPSHEDGSTDGLDVSELELSPGDNENDNDIGVDDSMKMQSRHFEPDGSSSDEEADLEPVSRKLPSHSDDSDSDFEIIDSREIANFHHDL